MKTAEEQEEKLDELLGTDSEEEAAPEEIIEPDKVDKTNEQEQLDASTLDDFLGAAKEVGGIELRSLTLADAAILQRVDSAFIAGTAMEDIKEPVMEICKFLAIMDSAITVQEAKALSKDLEALEDRAFDLGSTLSPRDINGMIGKIVEILIDSTSTQVSPVASHDDSPRRGKS